MSSIAEKNLINHLETLTRQHINLSESIDEEIYMYINKYYIKVTKSIFKVFNYYSINKSVLNHSDKELYPNAIKVMENYKALIKTYYDVEDYYVDCYAVQLISEIIQIVKSEYEIFEMEVKEKQNPISAEKNFIIDNYALNIATYINEIQNNFVKTYVDNVIYNFKNGEEKNYIEQFNIIDNIKLNGNMHGIFLNVSTCLKNCVEQLDDLENREVANEYFIFLKKQQEIMSSIIKQQITKLDEEITKKQYDESVKRLVSLTISQVIETYDLIESCIQSIENLYRVSEIERKSEVTFDVFNKSFNKYLEKEKRISLDVYLLENQITSMKKIKKDIFSTIEHITLERKKPHNPSSAYSIIKADYDTTITITEQFLNKLSKLNIYSKSNAQMLKNSQCYEIIDGVEQTMTIKSKVLLENKNILQLEIDDNIRSLNFNTENLVVSIADELLNAYFIGIKKENIQYHIEKYLKSLAKCKQCKFEILGEKVDMEQLETTILQKIYEFKKETLFYEISTFDEILYYSIEKIRDSNNINVKKYIMFIDDIKDDIIKLLVDNNIEIILPNPFDKFNSKEHKVLIAEQTETFKKGDIIKVNTAGYKQNETVILKANVIVAK